MHEPSHGNRSTQGSTMHQQMEEKRLLNSRGAEERVESGMVKEAVSRQQQLKTHPHTCLSPGKQINTTP